MGTTPQALSPAQVNEWPRSQTLISVSGQIQPRPTASEDPDQQFLQKARDRFRICVDAEDQRRTEMLTDQEFHIGKQWDPGIEAKRRGKGRPCHTINRLPEFTDHVVNNMRQGRPGIKIDPVGDGADGEQAEIRQGIIRHIERNSQADVAYDTGMEKMCIMGLGWLRILDDWSAPDSFDQDLFIRWVSNPFTVYYDPNCEMPDWSDGKFAFVISDLTPPEFISQFGDDKLASNPANFSSIGDQKDRWYPGGKIRVAEYFHIEEEKDVLCEVAPGDNRYYSDLPDGQYSVVRNEATDQLQTVNQADGSYVGRARKCFRPVVYWALITGVDKLRERRWKGLEIPLIPVIGHQVDLDGERILIGMVRYAREIQRMYNYVYSTLTEVIALAPRVQWVAAIDQLGEFRDLYERSNSDPQAVLPYVAKSAENGAPLPPPQRQGTDVAITGLITALQVIDNMLKSIFGIYDASLGQRGPQESGLAINARKIESDTSTYNWGDNFIRALAYLGRQLNYLLPFYYNTPGRLVQILRDDQRSDAVVMNQKFIDKKTGQEKRYNLDNGRYSVSVSTGPSQATRRKEAFQGMLDFFKMYPAGLQACADIFVKEADFPGKESLAARLEKMLPPGMRDPDENEPQVPPEAQQKIVQMQAMIQQLSQALNEASSKFSLERMKQEFETMRQAMGDQVTLAAAELKAKTQEATLLSQQIFNHVDRILNIAQAEAASTGQPAGQQTGQPVQTGQPSLAGPGTAAGIPSGGG